MTNNNILIRLIGIAFLTALVVLSFSCSLKQSAEIEGIKSENKLQPYITTAWHVEEQTDMKEYIVQFSNNGNNWDSVHIEPANTLATYNYSVTLPVVNYTQTNKSSTLHVRIKSVDKSGITEFKDAESYILPAYN